VRLGGQYVSQRLAQNTAASYLRSPPYFTADFLTEYHFTPAYAVRVNVYNLFDRHYIDVIHPFRAVPGAGRSASLTLELKI